MKSAKEILLPNSNRDFVLEAINQRKRIDGRRIYDYRNVDILFGADRGWCQVNLGKTKVTAHVSAEIVAPKPARPVEGLFYINLDLSPMAAPNFEVGRLSSYGLELNRLLERCLMESRCLDLDSLCIMAGEKVWCIRVEVHVLNHDGNILDCATIAAVTALSQFKRPDVTVTADEIIEHPIDEKEPVPLGIYHMPLSITIAFFSEGNHLVVDPTELEERVMEGKTVIGMNAYREICTLHTGGKMMILKDQILRCADIASKRVSDITAKIKKALSDDADRRLRGEAKGFANSIVADKLLQNKLNFFSSIVDKKQVEEIAISSETEELPSEEDVTELGIGTLITGSDKWDIPDDNLEETSPKKELTKTKIPLSKRKIQKIENDGSSEDELMILEPGALE